MALRPQPSMTGLEEMQRQFLLAGEVFVQRRIGVAALPNDVTDARAGEPLLAEQLHRRSGGGTDRPAPGKRPSGRPQVPYDHFTRIWKAA